MNWWSSTKTPRIDNTRVSLDHAELSRLSLDKLITLHHLILVHRELRQLSKYRYIDRCGTCCGIDHPSGISNSVWLGRTNTGIYTWRGKSSIDGPEQSRSWKLWSRQRRFVVEVFVEVAVGATSNDPSGIWNRYRILFARSLIPTSQPCLPCHKSLCTL